MVNTRKVTIWDMYLLKDPHTGKVRYVGRSQNVEKRFRTHLTVTAKSKCPLGSWIRELLESGTKPTLEVIDSVENKAFEASDRERRLIYEYDSGDLFNNDLWIQKMRRLESKA